MKKYILLLMAAMLLVACSNEEATEDKEASAEEQPEEEVVQEETEEVEDNEQETEEPETEEIEVEESAESEPDLKEDEIDISMYEYSKDVKITDAIDLNDYVSLIIEMNDNLEPGLAFQHATNQTYDFLMQDAIEGADKVGINIILNDRKIAMYEVNLADFKTNDDEPMAQLVLDAAIVEVMVPEVKDYAEIMELNYKEK